MTGERIAALGFSLILGCGPTITLEDETGPGTDGSSTSGNPPLPPTNPGTSTTTTTVPPATTVPPPDPDSGSDDRAFLTPYDTHVPSSCDFYEQDCGPGLKCSPYNLDGGSGWTHLACFSVYEDPAGPGEPCMTAGYPFSGVDDCDGNSLCFGADERSLEGTCVAFCTGSEDNPLCEQPGDTCNTSSTGFGFCLPQCDPLLQDCADGLGCYFVDGEFVCVPVTADAAAPGEGCEFINACVVGSSCLDPLLVPDCPSPSGCCSSFCEVGEAMPPCLPGQECISWYERGQAPLGEELFGVCVSLGP